jgi:hypothetical protein
MLDLNYKIGADGQKTLSATGSTIQSASITTSGFPVQITVTGDAEPNGTGWHELQIYRDSTAIGNILHIETTGSGKNMTVAMVTIDTPVTGTYTYSVKIVGTSGISATYTENGQLSMIVEEKVISSHNALNWLRREITGSNVYYGYSYDMNASDTDNTWAIKKITTSGSVETVKWANGDYNTISKWNDRVNSFLTPTGSLGLTCSKGTQIGNNVPLNISWSQLSGANRYQVVVSKSGTIYSDNGSQIYSNPNFGNRQITKEIVNGGSYTYNFAESTNGASPSNIYSITVTAVNVIGSSASTITITT